MTNNKTLNEWAGSLEAGSITISNPDSKFAKWLEMSGKALPFVGWFWRYHGRRRR
jgi:hypothetical protein